MVNFRGFQLNIFAVDLKFCHFPFHISIPKRREGYCACLRNDIKADLLSIR